jgi:hypothetical protein
LTENKFECSFLEKILTYLEDHEITLNYDYFTIQTAPNSASINGVQCVYTSCEIKYQQLQNELSYANTIRNAFIATAFAFFVLSGVLITCILLGAKKTIQPKELAENFYEVIDAESIIQRPVNFKMSNQDRTNENNHYSGAYNELYWTPPGPACQNFVLELTSKVAKTRVDRKSIEIGNMQCRDEKEHATREISN